MKLPTKFFDKNGNLTVEWSIVYAHAMHLSKVDDLPEELIEHVWESKETRKDIAELYELLDGEVVKKNPHPYFLKTSIGRKDLVNIDWQNLDAAMEDILRTALREQSTPNPAMERKMTESFKSTTSVQLTSPKRDTVCVYTITFSFTQATTEVYWLDLKNAKGRNKGQYEIPKGSHHFQISIEDTEQFPTGLYYWTLLLNGTPMTNRLYICTEEDGKRMMNG